MAEQALLVQLAAPKSGRARLRGSTVNVIPPGSPGWKVTVAATLKSLDLSRRVLGAEHQETFRWMSLLAVAVQPATLGWHSNCTALPPPAPPTR